MAEGVEKIEIEDTTSMLLRFRRGPTGYLATIMATGSFWRVHVFRPEDWIETRGAETLAISDPDRVVETRTHERVDIERLKLEAFAAAVTDGTAFPVSHRQAVHGSAVLEAIVGSAASGTLTGVA